MRTNPTDDTMTLASVPRYGTVTPIHRGDRAVVLGSGMAGLLAARVLSDFFDHVTVLERDGEGPDPTPRRGVPQGAHPHVLLEAGRVTIEDLVPGFTEELQAAGGQRVDGRADLHMFAEGALLAPAVTDRVAYFASRPLYEQTLRRRIQALSSVTIEYDTQFVTYRTGDDGAVTGVQARRGREPIDYDASLVVDAAGRTSRTPHWLESIDMPAPTLETAHIDLSYSSTTIERPPDDRRAYFIQPTPPSAHGGTIVPIEDDRWLVTMIGYHGDQPPTDERGFRRFADGLSLSDPSAILDSASELAGPIVRYPFPANRRYRYDRLASVPPGLVVVGDAMASYNPIYGQGMSVAALEAVALGHTLAAGPDAVGRRFFSMAGTLVDVAWLMAVGADFRFPQTTGQRPRGTALFNRYLAKLVGGAHTDGRLTEDFFAVINMERPPSSLFGPRVLWRVIRPRERGEVRS